MQAFDSSAMFGGAGFISQAPATETAQPTGEYSQSQESLRYLTVKQLAKVENGDRLVDGHPVFNVVLVGRARQVMHQAGQSSLSVQDTTGIIPVTIYLDQDSSSAERLRQVENGDYVKVVGRPETLDGFKISAFDIKALKDYNEIIHHNIQAGFEHMYLTRRHPAQGGNQSFVQPPIYNTGGNVGAVGGGATGMGPIHNALMTTFGKPAPNQNQGWDCREVSAQVVQQLGCSYEEVQGAIEDLRANAHIYSPGDDNFVMSCDL